MYLRFLKDCFAILSIFVLLIAQVSEARAQHTSPLAEGQWHKMAVGHDGIYKLSYRYLINHGIIGPSTNPQLIQIFGQGGGMLPQANGIPRPQGLIENAIFIAGEEDGKFDAQDFVLFYGQGPHKIKANAENREFEYEKNVYSDTSFYFITVGSEKGKRIGQVSNLPVNSPLIREFDDFFFFEEDKYKLPDLNSGRIWFGDLFNSGGTQYYPRQNNNRDPYHTLFKIAPNSTLTIRSALIATDTVPTTFRATVNGYLVQTVGMPASRYSQRNLYEEKGKIVIQKNQFNSNDLNSLDKFQVILEYQGSSSFRNAYLDYINVWGKCNLEYSTDRNFLFFRSFESTQHLQARFEINNAPADLSVWDITNPQEPVHQSSNINGNKLTFGTSTQQLKEFVSFRQSTLPEPLSLRKVANQDLMSDTSPHMVVVTHPSLLPEAHRLASFRHQTQGIIVKVVTTDQIYNEFSSGAQDITAIRDYMRHIYLNGGQKLRYLLLFGRGSFDYKKRSMPNFNLVPVYQSYNSTHPVLSYSSDDYYGFLEEDEGGWEEERSINHSLDIGIGRLPAKNIQEAKVLVDKLINYDNLSDTQGSWRNSVLFIADDEDNNIHHKDAERLSEIVGNKRPEANIDKIYLGAYPQKKRATGEESPATSVAITKAVEKGALFINYTGHGRPDVLAEENILTKPIFDGWKNQHKLPVFITATCAFGEHDNKITSGAEYLLLHPRGGAIGLVTASRPVYSHTNYEINSAFYEFALDADLSSNKRLGDIFRDTKNRGVEQTGIINRNFVLLGDPSMNIAFPTQEVVITDLKLKSNNALVDTLRAFEKVAARGFVKEKTGQKDTSFNGLLEAIVFEKPVRYETIDPQTPKMNFSIQDKVIFKGPVAVKGGDFEFSFVIPKSISYNFGTGKISLYSVDTIRNIDASGFYNEFYIGGSSSSPELDEKPPQVQLFLNDPSFKNGDKIGSKSTLIAYLEDENGINVLSNGIDGGISATLNGQSTFELNEFYTPEIGSYKKGSLYYQLESLAPGPHSLTLTVRDSYNNTTKSTIQFEVSGENDFQVYKLRNYPNPFSDRSRFEVEHSRAGEDLEAGLYIYDMGGRQIYSQHQMIPQSQRKLDIGYWDVGSGGRNILPGIYLYKIVLRSLSDGKTAEKTEKLVILN